MKQVLASILLILLLVLSGISCFAQKAGDSSSCGYPISYCLQLPPLTYDQWDKDYNFFDSYLTRDVMKTQMGLSYTTAGIQVWWCIPSARTHVQLDTATTITNAAALVGEWEVVCSRAIKFIDSAVYASKTIYRDTAILSGGQDAGGKLTLTENKFRLYEKREKAEDFKKVAGRHYKLVNGRILMLYGISKAAAAISFAGLDKEGNLIINSHAVEERKKPGVYVTYQAIVQQIILKRK